MSFASVAKNGGMTPSELTPETEGRAALSAVKPCCKCRVGEAEVSGNGGKFFLKYGRDKKYHDEGKNITYVPGDLQWEKQPFDLSLACHMRYDTSKVYVTIRAKATNRTAKPPKVVVKYASKLAEKKEDNEIDGILQVWKGLVEKYWSNKYRIILKDAKCPGDYVLEFTFSSTKKKAHISFDIIAMKDPRTDPNVTFPVQAALADRKNKDHKNAVKLFDYWRSHSEKFNILDERSGVEGAREDTMIPHEYGHWLGWGDEYMETEEDKIKDPADPTKEVQYELVGSKRKPIRIGLKTENITNVYKAAHGNGQERIDLSEPAVYDGLMATMAQPNLFHARYVFPAVQEFIELYSKDNATKASCEDVVPA